MFDPDGNTTDSDCVTRDNYSNQNNQQCCTLPTLSSSLSNNISRKRKLIASDESAAGYQRQQNQTSSNQGFSPLPPPAGVLPRSKCNAHHGTLMNGGVLGNISLVFNSQSPSSLSQDQDLASSFTEANAVLPGSAYVPSSLTNTTFLRNRTFFGQDPASDGIPSSMNSVDNPLQRLLRKTFPTSDGCASKDITAYDRNSNDANRNVMQSESNNNTGNVNQLSTLAQQQSDTRLPHIRTVSNIISPASTPNTPFEFENPSLGSNFNARKKMMQKVHSNSNQLIRNNQLFQQQVAMMTDVNASMPSHLMNVPAQARIPVRSTNDSIRPQIQSNSLPIRQILMRNEVIRPLDNDQRVAPTNKFAFPINNCTSDNKTSIQSSASLLYDCDIGRSKPLYLPCDINTLSEYQCLLRKQIELFEATDQDIKSSTKGRNKPIFLGQVGVRCIHCRNIKPEYRARGATYYPATLGAMYQSGQTMAIRHLRHHCVRIPFHVRDRLFILKDGKSSAGGGKKYWSDAASVMGVYVSDQGGLRFKKPPAAKAGAPSNRNEKNNTTKLDKEDPI